MPLEAEPEMPEETGGHPECTSGVDCLGTPTDRLVGAPRCLKLDVKRYNHSNMRSPLLFTYYIKAILRPFPIGMCLKSPIFMALEVDLHSSRLLDSSPHWQRRGRRLL